MAQINPLTPAAPHIRQIQAADLNALKAFLSGLSPGTLYFRFGRLSAPMWSEQQWQALCEPDPVSGAHFVATQITEPGRYAIVGIARLVFAHPGNECRDKAEFSLVVADHLQGHGLGRQLMHALVGEAIRRGLNSIYGDVLPSNTTMLSFCQGMGFVSRSCPDDARIYRMVLPIKTQKFSDVNAPPSDKANAKVRLHA